MSNEQIVYIQDLRTDLALDFQRKLEEVISKNTKKDRYYILAIARQLHTGQVETRFIISPARPPKLIGTICYYVDNKAGKVERLWILPYDIPVPDDGKGNLIEEVAQSAEGMPIIYGG